MPKVFNRLHSTSSQAENLIAITGFVSGQLMPELKIPEPTDDAPDITRQRVEKIANELLTNLADSKNLSFGNALEVAPAFGNVFVKFFKTIIKEGGSKIEEIEQELQKKPFNL